MVVDSSKTQLADRVLYHDGDSVVDENVISQHLAMNQSVEGLFVNHISDEIKQYNALVPKEEQILVKSSCDNIKVEWAIPEPYDKMDVRAFVVDKLSDECLRLADTLNSERIRRTLYELQLYEKMGLNDFLRSLIYIINTLQARDIVWGVGRGSSVSSYVLYLIGVHDVDSVVYDLDITDFLHAND